MNGGCVCVCVTHHPSFQSHSPFPHLRFSSKACAACFQRSYLQPGSNCNRNIPCRGPFLVEGKPCFRADFKHNFPRHMELLVELLWILLHSLRLTCLDHKHCAVCSFLEKKNALRVRICSIRVELLDFIYCSPTISAHPCDNGQECLGRRFTIMPDSEDGTWCDKRVCL